MDEIEDWIDRFDYNRAFDMECFLLIRNRDFDLDLSKYAVIDIEDGGKFFEMVCKLVKTTMILDVDRRKVVCIDGSVLSDKGVVIGIRNTLKKRYDKSIPIIVDMISEDDIKRVFNKRCKVIDQRSEQRDVRIMRTIKRRDDIEIYKKELMIRCFNVHDSI